VDKPSLGPNLAVKARPGGGSPQRVSNRFRPGGDQVLVVEATSDGALVDVQIGYDE